MTTSLPPERQQTLRNLALQMHRGEIFHDLQIHATTMEEKADLIGRIFLPILMMTEQQRAAWLARKPGLLYAPLAEALPTGINGYPIFATVHTLSIPESAFVMEQLIALKDLDRSFLEGPF